MKKNEFVKSLLFNLGIGIIFVIAAVIYCAPVLEGKLVYAGDLVNGKAAVQECVRYHQETGEYSWWTGSMFSGMPNYQIGGGKYLSSVLLNPFSTFFHQGSHNEIFLVLFYLIAFYILLRSFKINKWISLAGAFAIAFSSYFFIIIAARHNGKCISITWMTMVIVGFILTYRKKYGWGAILTMFFTIMGFFMHPQMSYYICMFIGILFFAELYNHIREKRMKDFGIATAIFAVAFAIGMGCGSANIFANNEYASQTMRGGHSDIIKANDDANKVEKGLDLDYATAWSYGIDETMTFLIPNYMGGASGLNVGTDSKLYKDMTAKGIPANNAKQFCSQAPTYWGSQPFTSGPVYMGAIVCFLFLLGLLIVKGPYKWALLIATLMSVLLSWGHNFMPLTKFFFDYFPMYNKFRAVSSILIIAEITIPLLGFLALKEISDKSIDKKSLLKKLYISGGITAGICLFFALFGKSILSFTSPNDAQFVSQIPDWLYTSILGQRASMMQSDAWRSFIFIALAAILVYFFVQEKIKTTWLGIIMTILVISDMWTVDRRFFNYDNFATPKNLDKEFAMKPYEKELLKDTTHFRVLNLSSNTFNEARTSYYLKSIGGYSGAKLRRYQDLIDEHISKEMNPLVNAISKSQGNLFATDGNAIYPVLNMLNMKYVIVPLQDGSEIPISNPFALGNAWFVDSLIVADNANEESEAIDNINLRTTAVLDASFRDYITDFSPEKDMNASIELTKYTPEYIEYNSNSSKDGTAVFSEIYYPYGWKALIDGKPKEHFRVDYSLRALNIPAGQHNIRFEFRPDSVKKGDTISIICIIIMFLTIIACASVSIYRWRKQTYHDVKK
ncbi:MAG: YfhO family protein [Bacteroidales bacterium]|nr:YfhO family protein [Bacteroidales bacterium]MDD2205620.1 YfhO family protein [Bacteroidales bacterium]MDD3914441.1 YfhO family protein [Bacteroidales bacterium]MDD4634880.1 YfhO family protein [Bacteroidales bacterium]